MSENQSIAIIVLLCITEITCGIGYLWKVWKVLPPPIKGNP